jgi:tRNA threonylcarbamoyladenosine biosynthesis protein TsaE
MLKVLTHDPEETQQVGRVIGHHAQPGDIYLLAGPLGAGKTCLTQGIAWGLGVAGHPRSPTFVLMTRYQGRLTLHHLDLYRIGSPWEAWDLGLEEQLLGDDVCVVEWADQAEEIFPPDALWIRLDYGPEPDTRTIAFGKHSPRYHPLLEKLARTFPVAGVNS